MRTQPPLSIPGIVYRHYDAAGQLLYVGKTNAHQDRKRHLMHARSSRWWAFVARIERERIIDGRVAHEVERRAIRAEQPIFNRTGNGKPSTQLAREEQYLRRMTVVDDQPHLKEGED